MLIIHLSQWLSILPVLAGLIFWKHLDKTLLLFWIYSIIMCFAELISELVYIIIGPNMFLYPIYGLLHFFMIGLIFIQFEELSIIKKRLKISLIVFLLLFGSEYFFLLEPNEMPALSMITGSVAIILIVFKFFSELLKTSSLTPLQLQPRFIIGTSLVIYAGSTIFYFLLFNYLTQKNNQNNEIEIEIVFLAHAVFNCIFYILNMFVFVSKWKAKTLS
jgi:hypothetical protein